MKPWVWRSAEDYNWSGKWFSMNFQVLFLFLFREKGGTLLSVGSIEEQGWHLIYLKTSLSGTASVGSKKEWYLQKNQVSVNVRSWKEWHVKRRDWKDR
jgi:hypothetical protein